MKLKAYNVSSQLHSGLTLAPKVRDWMDRTPGGYAYRCLPMLIANQSGWFILAKSEGSATWGGGLSKDDLKVTGTGTSSHFGSGIVTFNIPYLFRTEPGVQLLVRGPSNRPKDGVNALEGIVETDTSIETFTMNWMLTRPGTVTWEAGEPICMVTPIQTSLVENMEPEFATLEGEELEAYNAWVASRSSFNRELNVTGSQAQTLKWQKDYFQRSRTKLKLKEFK